MTRADVSASVCVSNSVRRVGTICHERPNRSFSQPHSLVSPPSLSRLQYSSTSSWVSH
jgi:hypothetical protein